MSGYEIATIVISVLSLVITSILTIYVFSKNKDLMENQTRLQKRIFEHQEIQDKLIYSNQNRPYIEATFKLIYNCYDFIENVLFFYTMKNDNDNFLAYLFQEALDNHKTLFQDFDYKFDLAISYSQGNLKNLIIEIKNCLIELEKGLGKFRLLADDRLPSTEKCNITDLQEDILDLCGQIAGTQSEIKKEMKRLLVN